MSDDKQGSRTGRDGCCADRRQPCPYHEGWQDAMDAVIGALKRDAVVE